MQTPQTQAVIAALRAGGAQIRFVGGCVRDSIAGRTIADIDLATDAVPERVMELIRAAGHKAIPTGIAHGTVTAVIDGKPFEITTLRRDIETDGRHATVAFSDDWNVDAARRDFTINAMSLTPDGVLHDPFGGRADLKAGRVRFVGTAHDRIVEDYLRLLRFFRIYAHFGHGPPDRDALAACRALAPGLDRLSAERIGAELRKLLAAPDPAPSVALMHEAGALAQFLPQATRIDRLTRLVAAEATLDGLAVNPMRRLAALLCVAEGGLDDVCARLRLSNAERAYLVSMTAQSVTREEPAPRHVIHRLGAATFRDLALLGWAQSGDDSGWSALLEIAATWTPQSFPLSGTDVLAAGIAPGPAVGKILQTIETWWIEGDFSADKSACLARLDAEIAQR
jgi:poly(A) polymerase